MTLARRKFLRFAAGAAALSGIEHAASAQNYPARPLRLILGYPAGGSTDLVARIMGAWLADRLGQSVVIENKPGAGTNLAVQAVVASPPDGYTLLFVATTNAINTSFHASLPFDFLRDLAPVAGLVELPFVMEVNPSLPANTVAEFIAHAKANPGKINAATFRTGTISHMAWELFKLLAGVDMVYVPYHADSTRCSALRRFGPRRSGSAGSRSSASRCAGTSRKSTSPVKVSCTDHEEARVGRIQTWDGKEWKISSDWYTSDDSVIAPMVKEAAAKYADEKTITTGCITTH